MGRSYKEKCRVCKKNYVVVSWKNRYPVCYDCLKNELNTPIEDEQMAKLFDIPEELYRESTFLRDIKLKYIRFGNLSEKQIETFERVVKEMLEGSSEEPQEE